MKIVLTVLTFILMSQAVAVTPIKKGEVAPHDGFIFDQVEEKELRQRDQRRIKLEELNILKDEKIEIQAKRIDNLKSQVKDLEGLNRWGKYGWYALGFIAATASLYISSQITENMR